MISIKLINMKDKHQIASFDAPAVSLRGDEISIHNKVWKVRKTEWVFRYDYYEEMNGEIGKVNLFVREVIKQ